MEVKTSQGCVSKSAASALRVGDVPIVDFNWTSICNNDLSNFVDLTDPGTVSTIQTYSWNFGDGDILTGLATDAVPGGTNGGRTSGTFKDPKHKYQNFGSYNATLTVLTNDGCTSDTLKRVFILPYVSATPAFGNEYFENFESDNGGWIAEAFNATNSTPTNLIASDTSWVWGAPSGTSINTTIGGANAWWTGKNSNTYYPNENSAVNGPCFDLTQLKRPMVAFDYFSDAEKNLDGAVLQYSINGGLTWRIVGPPEGQPNRDEGINWFNGAGILSNPGTQSIGNYGWTDKLIEWKNARFNLDMIPAANRSQVRLRVAFSSNDGNAPGNFDGFAFDNIYVGEKARNVLVEHFTTSTLNASVSADAYLNGLYQQQITDRGRLIFKTFSIT